MEPKPLTAREKDVLTAISDFLQDEGFPPSIRDLCRRLKVSSKNGVHIHLQNLIKKGYLARKKGSRMLEIAHNAMETIGGFLQIPILGRVPAGQPNLAVEDVGGYIKLDKSLARGKDLFALKVKGDSMEPEIQESDIVVIKPGKEPVNKDVVVARIDGEVTLKRLRRSGGKFILEPANPKYKSIPFQDGELVGVVIALIRSYVARNNG